MDKTSLGDRMKRFEAISDQKLIPKLPVIIRVDGKAFHTLTRSLEKPCDGFFQSCMHETAIQLCSRIHGTKLAYVQSDEISLLLIDYRTLMTQGWFDYRVQKMASVAASIASVEFNTAFEEIFGTSTPSFAVFDARVFNLPRHDVTNYFVWRQKDAVRNSIQSLARAHFSHNECNNKNCAQLQDMLYEKDINWENCPVPQKQGVCVVKESYVHSSGAWRTRWEVDAEIPTFTQDRDYINKHVYIEDK